MFSCVGEAQSERPEADRQKSLLVGTHIFNGVPQHYCLHLPKKPQYDRGMPVVFVFHGAGGQARGMMRDTGWAEKAEQEGFLVVFPEGAPRDREPDEVRGLLRGAGRTWNDGSGRDLAAIKQGMDHVRSVRYLLDLIKRDYPVDERRIYATGFSNGASMVFRLAREMPEVWAAVAPVAGTDWLHENVSEKAPPLLYITGLEDPLNPVEGGEVRLARRAFGVKPPLKDMVDRWVQWHGLEDPTRVVVEGKGLKREAFLGADGSNRIVVQTLANHGHHWPGGRSVLPERLVGPNQSILNATDTIWSFFSEHALPQHNSDEN